MRTLVAAHWGGASSPGWSQRLARSAPDDKLSAIREHDINEATGDSLRSIRATDLRATSNLLRRFNLFPPVQPHLQKYIRSHSPQITSRTLVIPSHRGAYHDRHG